jgi:acetyl-CoA carboxylase biotin carboxyl carrier protein
LPADVLAGDEEFNYMTASQPSHGSVFDLDKVRSLIELMKEHELTEVDLEEGDQKIRLCRGGAGEIRLAAPAVAPATVPMSMPAPTGPTGAAASTGDSASIVVVKSPMVGTFYARPNPNAEPFVKVGAHVNPESVICIIEAMKVFNEIQAEVRGRVVAVLVDDESPVEFGKPLFKVDTAG